MSIPKNLDPEALFRAVFREPEVVLERCLNMATDSLGEGAVEDLKQQYSALEALMEREPGHTLQPMIAMFETVFDGLGAQRVEAILREFVNSFRLPLERSEDVFKVTYVLMVRRRVREAKDDPGFGSAYTFFKQVFASYGRELWLAGEKRRSIEGEQEQHRYNLEDLQLLTQYVRTMDGDPSTDWSQRLADLWWRVYERPVHRVCLLLWLLGQEVRNPGKDIPPPIQSAGELFCQSREFTSQLGFAFPFRPDLNALRNAIHRRQTKIFLDLDIEFHDRAGIALGRLECDELADCVWADVAFCLHADMAFLHAMMTTFDERGLLDDAWTNITGSLGALGVDPDTLSLPAAAPAKEDAARA